MSSEQETDESQRIIGPMPSAAWLANQRRQVIDEATRAEEERERLDNQAFFDRLTAKAQAELARWGALPCKGELEQVGACADSYAQICPEREHGMCPRQQLVRIAYDERQKRALYRDELVRADVSPRTLRAVFDSPPIETEAVRVLREAFAATPKPCIVVLQGGVGCGKSCAAAVWAVERKALWVTAKALARMGYEEKLGAMGKASALVLDDLGTEYADAKGFFVSNLDGLIDDRYSRELPTVITTNVDPKEFKARYGERIADRIREAGKFIGVKGESMRRRA